MIDVANLLDHLSYRKMISDKAREKLVRSVMDAGLMHTEPKSRHGHLIIPKMDYARLAEPLMDIALLLPREYWMSLGNVGCLQASTDKSDAQVLWRKLLHKVHLSLNEKKRVKIVYEQGGRVQAIYKGRGKVWHGATILKVWPYQGGVLLDLKYDSTTG